MIPLVPDLSKPRGKTAQGCGKGCVWHPANRLKYRRCDEGHDSFFTLTPREREAFYLVIEGRTTKDIAEAMNVCIKTAENHRARMMEKLEVHNAVGVVRYAVSYGLL